MVFTVIDKRHIIHFWKCAEVAELADAGDSKSPGLNARAGSTPALGTIFFLAQ